VPNLFSYDVASSDPAVKALSLVRLLLNDVDSGTAVFTDAEITAFLALEGGAVKLAAAQAIDTNATDQALALKVLTDGQVTTDGAKLADAMRKHAAALRAQHQGTVDQAAADDGDFFFMVPTVGPPLRGPEGVRRPWGC